MLPKARRLHRRWMLYVGQCLTIGVIPLTLIGVLINGMNEQKGAPRIPWPILLAGMAGLFVVGIGMFIWRYNLVQSYDPNDEDVEARKLYGQSRAFLLSEEEVKYLDNPRRSHAPRVVRCEGCGRSYAYEQKRTEHGSANTDFEDTWARWLHVMWRRSMHAESNTRLEGKDALVAQRAAEYQRLLESGIEAIPCPACGWYQSNMIPKSRSLYRSWRFYIGVGLPVGLVPVAIIGGLINGELEEKGNTPIPWPIFVAALVCLFAAGIGMFIWERNLAQNYDPNDADVEARKLYGQTRATLLSDQEAKAMEVPPERLS
jgi:hypothetical protein